MVAMCDFLIGKRKNMTDEIILDLYTLIYMSTFFFIVGGCVFHLFIDRR